MLICLLASLVETVKMVEAGLHPKPTNTNRLFILDSEKAPTLAGYASADPDQQPISKQNLRGQSNQLGFGLGVSV